MNQKCPQCGKCSEFGRFSGASISAWQIIKSNHVPTGLFTRLESIAWSQQGFWQPIFCRKRNVKPLLQWENWGGVSLQCWHGEKDNWKPFYSTHFLSSRKAMERSTSLFPPSKQRVHKSQFLQKLSCQKPYWDQARLSSLVNKPVAMYRPLVHVVTLGNSFGALKKTHGSHTLTYSVPNPCKWFDLCA